MLNKPQHFHGRRRKGRPMYNPNVAWTALRYSQLDSNKTCLLYTSDAADE